VIGTTRYSTSATCGTGQQHQQQQQQAPRSMVHVTRICVVGTLETDLFRRIDEAAATVVKKTEGGVGVTNDDHRGEQCQ